MKPLVSVEIDIGDFGTIDTVTASDYAENSAFKGGNYAGSAISYKKNDLEPFILDYSELDNSKEYADIYNGLVSDKSSDSEVNTNIFNNVSYTGYRVGYWSSSSVGYEVKISGNDLKSVTIEFDSSTEAYPIVFKYQTYGSDSESGYVSHQGYSYTFIRDANKSGMSGISFWFYMMNKPNVPIIIKSITIDDVQTFSSQNSLISFKRGTQSVQDFSLPSYGIVANYGDVSFIDTPSKMIYNLINKGYIDNELDVRVYIEDNLVGTYKTNNDWNYDTYTNIVSVSFVGTAMKLQNQSFELSIPNETITALDLWIMFINAIPDGFFLFVDYDTGWLNSINLPLAYLNKASMWEQLNKFCNICQLRMYELPNGKIKVVRG